jgi:hypothetical protein
MQIGTAPEAMLVTASSKPRILRVGTNGRDGYAVLALAARCSRSCAEDDDRLRPHAAVANRTPDEVWRHDMALAAMTGSSQNVTPRSSL